MKTLERSPQAVHTGGKPVSSTSSQAATRRAITSVTGTSPISMIGDVTFKPEDSEQRLTSPGYWSPRSHSQCAIRSRSPACAKDAHEEAIVSTRVNNPPATTHPASKTQTSGTSKVVTANRDSNSQAASFAVNFERQSPAAAAGTRISKGPAKAGKAPPCRIVAAIKAKPGSQQSGKDSGRGASDAAGDVDLDSDTRFRLCTRRAKGTDKKS